MPDDEARMRVIGARTIRWESAREGVSVNWVCRALEEDMAGNEVSGIPEVIFG